MMSKAQRIRSRKMDGVDRVDAMDRFGPSFQVHSVQFVHAAHPPFALAPFQLAEP